MSANRISGADSASVVAGLQAFANWWAPEWFPPLTESDRRPDLPPALEWAIRFPPDFFASGEFVAEAVEDGLLRCFRSYGEPCEGVVLPRTDNPLVRFERGDPGCEPIPLDDFVVGTVIHWCQAFAAVDHDPAGLRPAELAAQSTMLWDGPYVNGPLRALLFGDVLIVQSPGTAAAFAIRR